MLTMHTWPVLLMLFELLLSSSPLLGAWEVCSSSVLHCHFDWQTPTAMLAKGDLILS